MVSATISWIPWLATRDAMDEIKQCSPVVAQAYRNDARSDAERVLIGPYRGIEAKQLYVRLTNEEEDIQGVLTEAPECFDTDQRVRMNENLRLISRSLNELGKVVVGVSTARPLPSPS